MAELSVKIGADVQDLINKLKISEKEFKKLALQAAKSGKTVEQVLKESGRGGTAFKKGLDVGAEGMKNLGKSTANAVPTLTSFSQVIQDAPYGIRGVANNITQLTSQFGYLSKATGGTKAALSSMLGSLAGPAGILFAVSAVTSLLVSYGDEIGNIIKGNNALASSQKAVNKALDEFYGGQVTKINSYVSILEDVNINEKQRKNVIDELIKTVPSLKKADFEYGNNLDIVREKIGQYVLAQAARIEADTLAEENASKLIKKSKIDSIKNIDDQQKRIEAYKKFLKEEGVDLQLEVSAEGNIAVAATKRFRDKTTAEIVSDFYGIAADLSNELKPVQDRINELYGIAFSGEGAKIPDVDKKIKLKPIVALSNDEIQETSNKQSKLLEKLFNLTETNNKALVDSSKKAQESILNNEQVSNAKSIDANNKLIATKIQDIYKKYGDLALNIDFSGVTFLGLEAIDNELKGLQQSLKDVQSTISSFGLDPDKFDLSKLNLSQLDVLKEKLESVKVTSELFTNSLSSAFSTLASEMTESINTGNAVLDAFISSLISGLTSLLSQLLAQQIAQTAAQSAIGATAAAAQAATATTQAVASGLVAKAQGVQIATSAAAALGPLGFAAFPGFLTAIQAQIAGALALAKIPAFATGGFTGDNHLIRVNGNEAVLTAADVFSLRNQIGNHQLNNNFRPRDNNMDITGEVILRGSTQVIQLRRAEKKMSRFYNS